MGSWDGRELRERASLAGVELLRFDGATVPTSE